MPTSAAAALAPVVDALVDVPVASLWPHEAQALIADFLGVKPESIWPSRYPKGKPRIFDSAKYSPVASQKAAAAADEKDAA